MEHEKEGIQPRKFIPIVTKGETTIVYVEEILYVQQDLRRIIVHTIRGEYKFYRKLEDLMRYFDKPEFYRCHKSCLINFERVITMKDAVVTFETGECITMGRESYRHARRNFTEYILKKAQ